MSTRAAMLRRQRSVLALFAQAERFITARSGLIVAVLLAATGALSILAADRRPLWNDEIFTLVIAGQPNLGAIWDVLHSGAEQIPPGFHTIEHASIELLGDNPIALRLPALIGVLAMAAFLYLFVARRLGPPAGLVALLVSLASDAFFYSYEGRPYGIVLGLAAAALYCWQTYAIGRRPWLAITGLAVSGAALSSVHYYAVLALLPIAVGEAVRSRARRRFDPLVWIALFVAVLPLVAWLPLIREASGFAERFWSELFFQWYDALLFYPRVLGIVTFTVAIGIAVAVLVARRGRPSGADRVDRGPRFPASELAAAWTFIALPMVAALAASVTNAWTERYVLAAILGAAILIAAGAAYLDRGRARVTPALCSLFALVAAGTMLRDYAATAGERDDLRAHVHALEELAAGKKAVVVADPRRFVELTHEAPPALARRLVYLADRDAALASIGTDSIDASLVGLAPYGGFDVREYGPYVARHRRLTILTEIDPSWATWLASELEDKGWSLHTVESGERGVLVLEATPSSGDLKTP